MDTQTKANNRRQLSGGQTRIIDIAILLSLCDLQNNVQDMKTNILLLDEIQRFREDLEEICENVCTCEKKEEKQTKIKEEKKEKEGKIIKMKN